MDRVLGRTAGTHRRTQVHRLWRTMSCFVPADKKELLLRNKQIESEIKQDKGAQRKEIKLLLLGTASLPCFRPVPVSPLATFLSFDNDLN